LLGANSTVLGTSLPVKKKIQLKDSVNLFNDLAKRYHIDCEVGSIEVMDAPERLLE